MDLNNPNDDLKRGDHNFSDAIENGVAPCAYDPSPRIKGLKASVDLAQATRNWAEADIKNQIKKDYSSYSNIGQKINELRSSLDTHNFQPEHIQRDT